MKRVSLLVFVLLAGAAVSSCGREGVPRLPAGTQDAYPRAYPPGAPPNPDPILTDPKPERV